jgi:lysophospholipase L1-like esterase
VAGLAEITLRLAIGPPIIWRYPQERYERDTELGYRLAPNQRSHTHDKLFETNSEGLRSPEVTRLVPAGTSRLLALGDSQTAGDGLLLEDTWPAQLAAQLEALDPATGWEVLNAGLSGGSPWQYAILLERLSAVYQIDGVVVALYVNDVTPRPRTPKAYVVTNTLSRRIGYVFKRSALFTASWQARRLIAAALAPGEHPDLEKLIISEAEHPLLEQGWQDLEAGMLQIRDFTEQREMGLWLIVLPRRDQVTGGLPGRAYNERSARLAQKLGIPSVDVLEPLIADFATSGQQLFIVWDGHNSALANRVIAREAADLILSTP